MRRNLFFGSVCAAMALAFAAGTASAQGILLSRTERVEVRIDGNVELRAAGSDINVGQEVEPVDVPVGVAFPDGSLVMAVPGSKIRVIDYQAEAPGRLELGIGEGITFFQSGEFPSSSYVLITDSGEPLVLKGTEVWTDQSTGLQIAIEVDDGTISYSNADVSAGDGTVLITYEIVNGQVVITSVTTTGSFVTDEMREFAQYFQSLVVPGGGLPIAGVNLPGINLLNLENAQQSSPTVNP